MGPPAAEERSEIVFFDIETTVPSRRGQGHSIIEFGAILVCPRRLVELHSYSTLVRPDDPSLISSLSVRNNGITPDAVASAPIFSDIADKVFDILHGRIWAGHNILKFDCARIKEAYEKIGRPQPEPKGTIDSLALLTKRFGRRAGDMKMATLATYFEIGKQTHRSLDDVRMNLEVLKYCATVLFLESSVPEILTANMSGSPKPTTRSKSNERNSPDGLKCILGSPSSSGEQHPIISLLTESTKEMASNGTPQPDAFDMESIKAALFDKPVRLGTPPVQKPELVSPDICTTAPALEECDSHVGFLEPEEVSTSLISASLVPLCKGEQKVKLMHKDVALQLFGSKVKVWFGISDKYVDDAGRPKLSIMVNIPSNLCSILKACDDIAKQLFVDSGSESRWRPVVERREGFSNYPRVRLHIPTSSNKDAPPYDTDIYQKDDSSNTRKLVFSRFDAEELGSLLAPGTFLDACFIVDSHNYMKNAGIRLVAKRLIIYSDQGMEGSCSR